MKKLRFFKALFVAAALALMIPGCSDVNSDEGTNIPQTQGNKVALKISASEGYRTALPTVDLTSYTYELTADEVTENTASNNPATLIPAGTSYSDLTKANSVYVEADKTYLFALKATNGSSGDILSGTLTKAISASDSTLSFQLFAIDSTSDKGSVSIEVTYADGYGVASVVPTLHNMDGTSLATDYPLKYTAGDTAGTGTITGSVPVGASYVNLVLKDESSTEIGSLPQEAVYAVKGLTSSGTVNVQVKKYKATVNVLSGGTALSEAKTVTLKMLDPSKTDGSELAVTKTLTQTSGINEYTGYVSVGSYNVYVDGNKYGVTVSNATVKEVDIAVISSIDFDFTNAKKEYFVGEEFVTTGITATAHYEGGTTGTIAAEDLTYTGFDSTAAATEQTITVTYSGFNGTLTGNTYTINVVEDTISSIAVKAEPTSKTFTVGEALNLDGLVITATYANGKTEDVTYDATETTGNASQFSVKYYSDESCETEVAVADIAAGTVYAKIVYAEKTTDKIDVTVEEVPTPTVTQWYGTLDLTSITKSDGETTLTSNFKKAQTLTTAEDDNGNKQTFNIAESASNMQIDGNGLKFQNTDTSLTFTTTMEAKLTLLLIPNGSGRSMVVSGPNSFSKTVVYAMDGEETTDYKITVENKKNITLTITNASAGTWTIKSGAASTVYTKSITISASSSSTPTPTDTTETLTWDFSSGAVSMYSDSACTTAVSNGTIQNAGGSAYLKGSSDNVVMQVGTPVSGKIGIRNTDTNKDVQVNAGALFYIPVSEGSEVTVTQRTAGSYELGGDSSLTYIASSAGYVVYEVLSNHYLSKIVVTNVNASDDHSSDVVSFVSKTDSTTANATDVLGFEATSVSSSDETVATVDLTSKSGFITVISKKAGTVTITATGSNSATTSWTVTIGRYGKITLGTIEKYTIPTLTPAITLTAVGSSDIKLSYSNGTLTASAVSGATVAENGYTWYVDNALQSGSTSSTLDVSTLGSGIHSIVVTATDSDTNVEYAAQYVLTVQ